jgi:hypothetical protein
MSTITNYKRLGSTTVTANVDTTLYTVPALKEAIVSSLVVCNTSTGTGTFTVAITSSSSTPTTADYIYKSISITGNNTFIATTGFTMSAGNKIVVQASIATIVFSVFGSEIT